ncbi:MAG: radical SAM protein [Rhodospirillales bacterium]
MTETLLKPAGSTEPTRRPKAIERALLIYPFAISDSYNLNSVLEGGSFAEAPLGLGYISSYIQRNVPDLEVRIVDANAMAIKHILATKTVDMDELYSMLRDEVADFDPDIVGISCLFHNIAPSAHAATRAAREIAPDSVIVMGGNYPAGSPEIALADEALDFIVLSEGEQSFSTLIECLRNGFEPNEHVDGIMFRDTALNRIAPPLSTDGDDIVDEILSTPKLNFPKSLEGYPWPDRKDVDIGFYASYSRHFAFRTMEHKDVRLATMTASRGCPFKCSFCSSKDFWGLQIRYREPIDVVNEMEMLVDQFDINTFIFNDDNIMFNRKSVIALCDEIKRRNLKIRWLSGGGIQVSSMKPDVVQALIETGLNQFNLAIETGNPETLKRINKPLAEGVAEKVIAEIRKYDNIWIGSNFITGFYFETLEDIQSTLDYAGSLDLDWRSIYAFQPLPGTEDFRASVARGYIEEWDIWSEGKFGDLVSLTTENFTAEQVRSMNYYANLKHNFINNRNLNLNPRQAIKDFNYVIEMVPDHAVALYCRAIAKWNLGDFDSSNTDLERAREIAEATRHLKKSAFKSNIAMTNVELVWVDYFERLGVDLSLPLTGAKQAIGITEAESRQGLA